MRPQVLLVALVALVPATVFGEGAKREQKARGGRQEDRGLRVGVEACYGDDAEFGVGGRLLWGLPGAKSVDLVGSFDYFFPPETKGVVTVERKQWEANANLAYNFDLSLNPYVGTGLNVTRRTATLRFLGEQRGTTKETELGLNLLAGVRLGGSSGLRFFLEGRYEVKGGEQVVASAGVLF